MFEPGYYLPQKDGNMVARVISIDRRTPDYILLTVEWHDRLTLKHLGWPTEQVTVMQSQYIEWLPFYEIPQ